MGEAEDTATEAELSGTTHLVDWITGHEGDLDTARTDRAERAVSAERDNAQVDRYAVMHRPEPLF